MIEKYKIYNLIIAIFIIIIPDFFVSLSLEWKNNPIQIRFLSDYSELDSYI